MTDNEVRVCMERVRVGDRQAFERLVEAYWPLARHIALGILGDSHLAEDVAQDCFADIYVQRARYQAAFSFQAYLTAIVRHKSIDLLRRRRPPSLLMVQDTEAQDHRTPESLFVSRMYRNALFGVVEALDPTRRRMLKAYALEGKSYKGIARELGVTVAQVKITLHRVRSLLRRTREEWEK